MKPGGKRGLGFCCGFDSTKLSWPFIGMKRGYWYKVDVDESSGVEEVSVDNDISRDDEKPKIKSGVTFGDGDGTVSVLSLGAMCVDGWKRKEYNPAGVRLS